MSNTLQSAVAIIAKQEAKFGELVKAASTDVVFKQEMLYASQAMMSNDYLCSTALRNPLSLRNAFSQVAACGLTLNPARGLCYLVPRDSQVVLDVSYKGIIKTAVNDGAIRDCIVELVYSNDKFEYQGKRHSPIHKFNPFDKKESRGEFLGVYVEATLPDGRVHVEAVTAEEIFKAREASELWKRKKKGPWVDFEESMYKKSGIKIARKYWPQAGEKLDRVIHYLNTEAGEGFVSQDVPVDVIGRYIGAEQSNEAASPLPTSNEVNEQNDASEPIEGEASVVEPEAETVTADAKATQPEQAQEQADEPAKANQPSQPASSESDDKPDLPPKVLKRIEEVINRARQSGSWAAARDFMSDWPVEARDEGLRQLKAAEYRAAQGE